MRIAADLQDDDVRSSLSRIAILSDVAQRRTALGEMGEPLRANRRTLQRVVDSTSGLVWAIHPRKDRFTHSKQRLRRFRREVLSARGAGTVWKAFEADPDIELGPDLRRQAYLAFKESGNNIIRHSPASEAMIELRAMPSELLLTISDNGCGVEPSGKWVEVSGIASGC